MWKRWKGGREFRRATFHWRTTMTRVPKFIIRIGVVLACLVAGIGLLSWRASILHKPQDVSGLTAIHVAAEGDGAAGSHRMILPDGTSILLTNGSRFEYTPVESPVKGFKATLDGEAIIEKTNRSMRL